MRNYVSKILTQSDNIAAFQKMNCDKVQPTFQAPLAHTIPGQGQFLVKSQKNI